MRSAPASRRVRANRRVPRADWRHLGRRPRLRFRTLPPVMAGRVRRWFVRDPKGSHPLRVIALRSRTIFQIRSLNTPERAMSAEFRNFARGFFADVDRNTDNTGESGDKNEGNQPRGDVTDA